MSVVTIVAVILIVASLIGGIYLGWVMHDKFGFPFSLSIGIPSANAIFWIIILCVVLYIIYRRTRKQPYVRKRPKRRTPLGYCVDGTPRYSKSRSRYYGNRSKFYKKKRKRYY